MTLKQLFLKFSFLSTANMLAMLAAFGVVLVIVRAFGAEGLGRISLVMVVLNYAVLLSGSGIEAYSIREVAAKRVSLDRLVTSLFAIRFFAAVVIYVAMLALVMLVPSFKEQLSLFLIMGLTILIIPFRTAWVAQSQHKTHVLGLFNLGVDLSYLAGVLLLSTMSFTLIDIAWVKVFTELLVTVWLLYWVHKRFGPFLKPLPLPELKSILRSSWPFASFPLIRFFSLGIDLILLSFFVSITAVGLYSSASKLFFVFLALSAAYMAVLYPRLAELSHQSEAVARKELFKTFRVVMPLAMAGMLVMLPLSGFVLRTLFGEEFLLATTVLQILLVAFVANLACRHYRQMLLIAHFERIDLIIVSVNMATHIILKLALIPIWGIEGAALGTAIGEVALLLSYIGADYWLFGRKKIQLN